ncbi:MAG: DNA-binding protein [Candidatus Thermoplasmatota archaeon]
MDEELDKLRKKRLKELQNQQQLEDSLQEQEQQQEEYEQRKKMLLIQILTPKARERLGNIRVARPQIAENIEKQLIMLAQSGRLNSKIDDNQLRQILKKVMPKKRDYNIKRR